MSVDHFCGYCGFILNPKGYKRCIQCSFETRYCDADCLVGHRQHVHPNPWPLKEGTMSEQSPELARAVERVRERHAYMTLAQEDEFDAALAAALRLAVAEGAQKGGRYKDHSQCGHRTSLQQQDCEHDRKATIEAELAAARAVCEAQDGGSTYHGELHALSVPHGHYDGEDGDAYAEAQDGE